VVGVGDDRQLGHSTDARGLFGELAESDQGKVGSAQHLQRGNRTAEDAHFKPQVSGNAGRHRVEDRRRVIAGVGSKQLAEVTAQILMRKPGHMSSTNTKEWKGLSKGVNAEGTKGYHAKEGKMMTNFAGGSDRRGPL
jgi:hypothetical protein